MKVQDLISELSKYDPNEDIIATWEGITREISVYQAKDGTIMLDVDDNSFKEEFISGEWNPKKWIYSGDNR